MLWGDRLLRPPGILVSVFFWSSLSGLWRLPLPLSPTNTHTERMSLIERYKIIMTSNQKERKLTSHIHTFCASP